MRAKQFILFHLFFVFCSVVFAQQKEDLLLQNVKLEQRKYKVKQLLDEIIPSYGLLVSYNDNIIPVNKKITFQTKKTYTVKRVLEEICRNENLQFEVNGHHVLLKYYERPDHEYQYTIAGKVRDYESGDELISSTIYIKELKVGMATNAYGFYSLTLPKGKYEINCSHVGFEAKTMEIELDKNISLDFDLKETEYQLNDVQVFGVNPIDMKAQNILLSTNRVDMDMAKNIPYVGEVDIFQSSMLLPGVSNIGEGVSGVNVRSGNADRNLIMLDEATLYSSNHFFGLISIFNPDATRDVEILKGDYPAKYGGRVSSVMHVRQREGDVNKFRISGGIGLVTSRLLVEGPTLNQKASYLLSARSTFWDLILRNIPNPSLSNIRANFQDFNAKFKYEVNASNKIHVSGYYGSDATKFGTDDLQKWGNALATVRWNSIIKNRHFMNFTTFYSRYQFRVINEEDFSDFVGHSSINDFAAKVNLTSYINPYNILEYGITSNLHIMQPGKLEVGPKSNLEPIALNQERGLESAVYLSSENRLLDRFTTQLGIRVSNFYNFGTEDVYIYEEGESKSNNTIIDTLAGGSIESKKEYWNFLPRASLRFQLAENTSFKTGYSKSVQYISQLSNTVAPSSSDMWKISDKYIKPIEMDQVTVGVYQYFKKLDLHLTTELYYRFIDNIIDYKSGADLIFKEAVETELLFGNEQVYGAEFLAKKSIGKFAGWVGYTYSNAQRQIVSEVKEDEINNGNYFPSDFDRRHDLSLTAVYKHSRKWVFSSNFVFYSGRPYSFPDSKYEIDGVLVPHYPTRNQDRLSNYHRLDLAVTLNLKSRKNKNWSKDFNSSWVFSLYNVYGRKNAQAYFFTNVEGNTLQPEIQQLSVLGFPIPSVTYNFKF